MHNYENHATQGDHARVAPGSMIANKYQVVGEAGVGNFARVFEAVDVQKQRRVAIKLLKHGYENDANFECDILQALGRLDPDERHGVVSMIERFEWKGHATIVFTLKGKPLRSHRMPMERDGIARVAKEVAESLSFLHFTARVVHTDLKPENILEELPGKNRRWSVCDLGSASFYTAALDKDLITTRPYRAPEVVLNRGWSYAADTWSLACILFELKTGRKLFDGNTDAEHVDAMQQRLGPMPAAFGAPWRGGASSRRWPALAEELRGEPQLLDLLQRMLCYEPSQRLRCSEVGAHPFVALAAAGQWAAGGAAATAAPHAAVAAPSAAGQWAPSQKAMPGLQSAAAAPLYAAAPLSSLSAAAAHNAAAAAAAAAAPTGRSSGLALAPQQAPALRALGLHSVANAANAANAAPSGYGGKIAPHLLPAAGAPSYAPLRPSAPAAASAGLGSQNQQPHPLSVGAAPHGMRWPSSAAAPTAGVAAPGAGRYLSPAVSAAFQPYNYGR